MCMYVRIIIIIIIIIIETWYHTCSDACLRVEENILQHFKKPVKTKCYPQYIEVKIWLHSRHIWLAVIAVLLPSAPFSRNIWDYGDVLVKVKITV
jgi:hypothetical protein